MLLEKPIREALDYVKHVGAACMFFLQLMRLLFTHGVSTKQIVDQMYAVGVKSLPTTLLAGGFVGAIMAIQINIQLRDFGAQGFLGGLSTSVTIRNVGPVLIAFILSGKVGAYTSAELGTMQVTEQINAIRCLGADPVRYLILPRMVAVVLSSFFLLIVGLMMTIGGGVAISSIHLGINPLNYTHHIPRFVSWWSVATGAFKSFIFGVLIAVICCYRGYTAKGGAIGVGETVKTTAVETLVTIIIWDFVLSQIAALLHGFLARGDI